jgi:hypothetical protein
MLCWILWLVLRVVALVRHRFDIVVDGKLYLSRWYLTPYQRDAAGRPVGLELWWRKRFRAYFLHCFHASDPNRGYHSHPWVSSESLILRGEYVEHRRRRPPSGYMRDLVIGMQRLHDKIARGAPSDYYRPGCVNRLDADDFHRVKLLTPRVWTLFRAGELHGREWDFMHDHAGGLNEL